MGRAYLFGGKMHRLFAALPVPGTIADRLEPLQDALHGARWRRRDHYHITLCFYGDVSGEVAEEIARNLEAVSRPALCLEVAGVGWFGRREPRALYARIAPDDGLDALAADCHKIARRLGLRISKTPYVPHITLAYCHNTPLDAARLWSENYQVLKTERFDLDRFHLYESFTQSGKPSRYVAQTDYDLGF